MMNLFEQEIQGQPRAVRDTAAFLRSPEGKARLEGILQTWNSGRYRRILATGMGSSFFLAEAFAALSAREGLPAFALNAGELLHYQKPLLKDSLLLAISQSGQSYETLRIVQEGLLPRESVIALTNEPQSPLAALSGHVLETRAGVEKMTSTKTFITAWQAAFSLVMTLAGKTEAPDWEALGKGVGQLLETPVSRAADLVGDASFLHFTARGTDFASARQAALMCMEALHLSASALTGGDFRHGPLEMVGPDQVIVVLTSSTSPTYAQSLRLTEDILRFGGRVILVSDKGPESRERLRRLPLPTADPALTLILQIIPLQRLVCELARRRGLVPGDFHHGHKVTGTE